MTSIWVPKLIFSNTVTKPSTIVDEETMMYVEKQGDYEQSSIEDVENVRYYYGHENQLHMQRFYNQKWDTEYRYKNISFAFFLSQNIIL